MNNYSILCSLSLILFIIYSGGQLLQTLLFRIAHITVLGNGIINFATVNKIFIPIFSVTAFKALKY